ncbi:unnamed protein product, partial [Durusdinium trenchii]
CEKLKRFSTECRPRVQADELVQRRETNSAVAVYAQPRPELGKSNLWGGETTMNPVCCFLLFQATERVDHLQDLCEFLFIW